MGVSWRPHAYSAAFLAALSDEPASKTAAFKKAFEFSHFLRRVEDCAADAAHLVVLYLTSSIFVLGYVKIEALSKRRVLKIGSFEKQTEKRCILLTSCRSSWGFLAVSLSFVVLLGRRLHTAAATISAQVAELASSVWVLYGGRAARG